MYCLINEQIECFIPDKIRTASVLNGFKSEPFRKFIDVKILKIQLIENGKRVFGPVHTETFPCVFVLFTFLKGIELFTC